MATRLTGRQWAALAVLVLPVLLISVDMTVLSFALPAISTALAPTGTQLLWIVDGYSLAIAGLLVTAGTLGDRYGRRRMLLIGGGGFGLVSLLAATADTAEALVAARIALGVFGAGLMPSTLALLRSTFTDREQRRTAFAVWAGGFAAGAAVGPVVGGWLLEHFWWGSVFLLNVPVMLVLLVAAPLLVRESRSASPGRLDATSVVVSVLALTSAVQGVKTLAHDGPGLAPVLLLAVGAGLGALFVRRQQALLRTPAGPLLDVDLFRLPVFRTAVLANLLSICGMTGMVFAVSQYTQLVLGLSPVHAGLLLLPGAALSVLAGLTAARLVRRVRLDLLIATGLLLGAAGYAVAALLGPERGTASAVQLAVAFAVLSTGVGLAETLTNDAILSAAPADRAGAASAISETAYEVGAVLGTTVLGSLLGAVYRARVEVPAATSPADARTVADTLGGAVDVAARTGDTGLLDSARAAFSHGLDVTAVAGALLSAAAALVVWRALRPRRSVAATTDHQREEHVVARTPDEELPSTLERSDEKARDTYAETLDSAQERYGDGSRAHRTAWAAVKHTHEKVGDHWEPKEDGRRGPSDRQSAEGGAGTDLGTSGGVDENASKEHLLELARRLDVRGRSRMTKAELVDAVRRANDRSTARARS